jgi:hypothetical protein
MALGVIATTNVVACCRQFIHVVVVVTAASSIAVEGTPRVSLRGLETAGSAATIVQALNAADLLQTHLRPRVTIGIGHAAGHGCRQNARRIGTGFERDGRVGCAAFRGAAADVSW